MLDIPAIVFSPPGIRYSHLRFGVALTQLERTVVGIVPEGDVVPMVDYQAGMMQKIACRQKNGAQELFIECHSMERTACEIWRVCGDPRRRDFTNTCSKYTEEKMLGKYYGLGG